MTSQVVCHPWSDPRVGALATSWDELAQRVPQQLPMLSHAWLDAFARTRLPSGATLHCAFAMDGERLVGVLPIVLRAWGNGPVSAKLGSTPYDQHTAFGDALVSRDGGPDAVAALIRGASAQIGSGLMGIVLRGVSAASVTARLVADECRAFNRVVTCRGAGSYLPVPASWDFYYQGLSKNFRQNLRKATNRLRNSGVGHAFEFHVGEAAGPEHLDTLLRLESSGWKARAGTAIAQHPRLVAFYRRLAENLRARGWLEWHIMRVAGVAIAAQMAVRFATGSLVMLKIAYDESYSMYSPGALLFEHTVRREVESGNTAQIDCLTDMAWHRPWRMLQREYFDQRWYPRTIVGLGLGWGPQVLYRAARRLKLPRRQEPSDS